MTRSLHRIAVIAFAVPVFLFFPLGVAVLAMTGKQLVWGFDDMPLGAMLLGLVVGGGIALLAFIFVYRRAKRRVLLVPLVVTIVAAVFDCASIPVARHITERVEHPERFSLVVPKHSLQRTRHGVVVGNPCASCVRSLSLGRLVKKRAHQSSISQARI